MVEKLIVEHTKKSNGKVRWQTFIEEISNPILHKLDEIGNNTNILAWETLLCENKKSSNKKLPSQRIETWASHYPWFKVQHYPFWIHLEFACMTETLEPFYSHALLILTESSSCGTWIEV